MTISGTIEQAPSNAYYFTDVASNDILFRAFQNASFCFGGGSNVPSSLKVNSNTITMMSGLIGIGTSNPQGNLHVYNGSASPSLLVDGGGYGNRGVLKIIPTNAGNQIQSGVQASNDSKADIVFSSYGGTTEWMRIKSSTSNIGIGTSTPQYKLDVNGSGNFTSVNSTTIAVSNISAGTSCNLNIGCDSNTSTVNIACTSNVQTVNIGTGVSGGTTINIGGPSDTICIAGTLEYVQTTDMAVTDKLVTLNKGGSALSGTGVGIAIEESNAITGYIKTSSDRNGYLLRAPNSTTDLSMDLSSGGMNINANAVVLDSSGNFGISTATPTVKLDVAAGDIKVQNGGNTADAGGALNFSANPSSLPMSKIKGVLNNYGNSGTQDQGGIAFFTRPYPGNSTSNAALAEKVRIDHTGALGIGTSTPSTKLHVVGDTLVSGGIHIGAYEKASPSNGNAPVYGLGVSNSVLNVSGWNGIKMFTSTNSSNFNERLSITSAGLVGIGTSNPTEKIHVMDGNLQLEKSGALLKLVQKNVLPYMVGFRDTTTSDLSILSTVSSNEFMTFKSNGNIGFNTTSPQYLVDVNGIMNASNIYMNGMPISIGSFWMQKNGGNWSGCNMAIGALSNQQYTLNVYGAAYFGGSQALTPTTQGSYINWNQNGSSGQTQFINHRGAGTGGFHFDLYNSNGFVSTPVLIDGTGNMGVGTTSPSAKVDVLQAVDPEIRVRSDTNLKLRMGVSTAGGTISAGALANSAIIANDFGPLQLATKYSSNSISIVRMTFDSNGNAGLGTITPNVKLTLSGQDQSMLGPHINAYTSADNYPLFQILPYSHNNVSLNFDCFYDGTWKSSSSTNCYSISKFLNTLNFNYASNVTAGGTIGFQTTMCLSNANVGIGTSSPAYKLDVSGTTNSTTIYENGTLLSSKYALSNAPLLPLSGGTLTGILTGTTINASNANFSNLSVPGTLTVVNITDCNIVGSNLTMSKVYASQHLGNATDTSSTPGHTWCNDTVTGMFHPALYTIGFSTSGSERLRISPTGTISTAYAFLSDASPGGYYNGFTVNNSNINLGSGAQMTLQTGGNWGAYLLQTALSDGNYFKIDLTRNGTSTRDNAYYCKNYGGTITHNFTGGVSAAYGVTCEAAIGGNITGLVVNNTNVNYGSGAAIKLQTGANWSTQLYESCQGDGNYFRIDLTSGGSATPSPGFAVKNYNGAITALHYGNVGIGTTTPTAPLHVAGSTASNFSAHRYVVYNSTGQSANYPSAPVSIYAENRILCAELDVPSDIRLKKDIAALEESNMINVLESLKPCNYTWKDPARSGKREYGFIAQEVESVLPSAIQLNENYIACICQIYQATNLSEGSFRIPYDESNKCIEQTSKVCIMPKDGSAMECSVGEITSSNIELLPVKPFTADEIKSITENGIFVEGIFVNDMRTLDTNPIVVVAVANVKRLHEENKTMKTQMANLQTAMEQQQVQINNILAKLNNA